METKEKNHDALLPELINRDINGWEFFYESQTISWGYTKNDHTVYCTPDWEDMEGICVQHNDKDGNYVGEKEFNEPIPYKDPLTAEQFIALMTPVLKRIEELNTEDFR